MGSNYFRSRIEGYRWLRSDGKPSFSTRVYRVEKELERLAKKIFVSVSQTSPVLDAIEKMYTFQEEQLLVLHGESNFSGLVTSENVIDYLGGGELYNIVMDRHGGEIHSALNEQVKTIMIKESPFVYINEKLPDVISSMIKNKTRALPVLYKDNTVYGIITQRDIVMLLAEKRTGVKAGEICSPIISVNSLDPLIVGMKMLVQTSLDSIYVKNEMDQIIGTLDSSGIVQLFGSHEAFKFVKKGYLTEVNSIPIKDVMQFNIERVYKQVDMGDVISKMFNKKLKTVLVTDENDEDIGMITFDDAFFVLALPI
ncbi:CBS domain-containing protein [Fervidicoccus fontis]|uniref:Putative signal transduction protein with CBS domains n=1 Tax=Fervidicoccus fontis (strain DSM 19380 / JCM 18336 / VKM B-2539 / Kam940) TaxID=1163730 RepID=H9ZZY1_FERFK|nr:CBS domain-containing protein [Fervidicoccus fontis]AFH42288.1 putative signal transduction protein with CBS domains [Fervidicoccus fontis Kam940]